MITEANAPSEKKGILQEREGFGGPPLKTFWDIYVSLNQCTVMSRGVHKCVFVLWTVRYIGKWVPIVKGVETICVCIFLQKIYSLHISKCKKLREGYFCRYIFTKGRAPVKKKYHFYCTLIITFQNVVNAREHQTAQYSQTVWVLLY